MDRGCETLFRAITLKIIFYLPANYRISLSACRPACPCSPHSGRPGNGPLINPPVFDLLLHFQLAPAQHKVPFASSPSLHIPWPTSQSPLIQGRAALPWQLLIPVFGHLQGRSADEHPKRECFALGCTCLAASAQPPFNSRWDSPGRSVHQLRAHNSRV